MSLRILTWNISFGAMTGLDIDKNFTKKYFLIFFCNLLNIYTFYFFFITFYFFFITFYSFSIII